MAAFGFMEILVLALLSGGASSTDLVALIPPEHYFKSRDIEISPARAVELANMDPKTPKAQIMQLTALRYLFDETEALKKSPRYLGHRQAIEPIAQGKNAQDGLGFAKEYAQRVLRKLDAGKPDVIKLPPVREDALSWFPAHVKLVAAFDFRHARVQAFAPDPVRDLLKMLPDDAKREMYNYLEQVGNIRLERVAFAMTEIDDKRDESKIYIRLTGKLNEDWAVDAIKKLNPRFEIKSMKDEAGTSIVTAREPKGGPIMALVGNTELLVVGFQGDKGKHEDLLTEILAVRAKKQPNALTGPLKDRIAKVPDKAVALLVADLPKDLRRELAREFHPSLDKVTAFIERVPQGLDLQAESTLPNKDDAGQLVQKIGALRKLGIEELRKEMGRPPEPGFPPIPFQSLINLLESLQVQNKEESVQVRMFVPDGLLQQVGSMAMMFGAPRRLPPPPPPPKIEKN